MKRNVLALPVIALSLVAGLAVAQSQGKPVGQPAAAPSQANVLKIGDDAPPLKVGKWVKGSEVSSFQKGHVYVVELWATWCGPCKYTIPHLTEMQKKHKDNATIIGVSVIEHRGGPMPVPAPDFTKRVEDFVAEWGDKMNYTVAIDDRPDNGGSTCKNWLNASGQQGIPSAYIVNGDGKIAWIGYATDEKADLSGSLDKVVKGEWDIAAAAQRFEQAKAEEKAQEEKQRAAMQPIMDAVKAKDYVKLGQLFDARIAAEPDNAINLKMQKFSMLVVGDPAQAYATAEDLAANEFKTNSRGLNQLSWMILSNKNIKSPNYELAAKLAQQAFDATGGTDGMVLDTLALAKFKSGNVDEAITLQTKAIDLAKNSPEAASELAGMQKQLEEFKTAKDKK